jgi:signal peptide peptidase SppA
MKHARFISWCLSTPWALMPERMQAYAQVLARQAFGPSNGKPDKVRRRALAETMSSARSSEFTGDEPIDPKVSAAARKNSARAGAIAVIPIYGTIVQRASQLDLCELGTSTLQISAALADAMADDSVAQILLDIDSPGGSVYGVQELGAEIAASRKPIVAIANSLCASAAYWLGSQASELYCTPGGEVGSVGVWMAHQDWSKALEMDGVAVTLISAGEFKVEANPYQALSPDAHAFLQSRVSDYYTAFTRAIAKGRKVSVDQVRGGMGKGRVLGADDAKGQNMIDGIATFEQVVAKMQKSMQAAPPKAAEAPAPEPIAAAPSRLARAKRELAILGD